MMTSSIRQASLDDGTAELPALIKCGLAYSFRRWLFENRRAFLYTSAGATALVDPSRRRRLRDNYQEIHAKDKS